MKKLIRKITCVVIGITLLFSASAHSQPKKSSPQHIELKKKIDELNKQIKTATTNKARLQRNRDQLLRKLKELASTKKP